MLSVRRILLSIKKNETREVRNPKPITSIQSQNAKINTKVWQTKIVPSASCIQKENSNRNNLPFSSSQSPFFRRLLSSSSTTTTDPKIDVPVDANAKPAGMVANFVEKISLKL